MSLTQFDLVGVVNADNITWLSTSRTQDFRGQWSVIYAQDGYLVIARGEWLLRIPETDVRLLVHYDLNSMFEYMKGLIGHGRQDKTSQEK